MDALFIINSKSKDILITKEFNNNDNILKMQIFLSEINNILKEDLSPIIIINNTIFLYKSIDSSNNKICLDDNNMFIVAIISQDVIFLFNKINVDTCKFIKQNSRKN